MTERNPGRVTLAEVAERAGVSASTASLAFSGRGPVSDLTRERVMAAASELNYAGPDPRGQSLRRGTSGIVGVLIADRIGVSFRDPVLIQTLDGLADEIQKIGASLLLIPELDRGTAAVANAPIDALVLLCVGTEASETARTLGGRGVPVVQIEGPPSPEMTSVNLDNFGGGRLAAEHLAALGHTRVATVTLSVDRHRVVAALTPEREATGTVETMLERLRGAREVYPEITGMIAGSSRVEAGRLAALRLLDVPAAERPTAIIAQSDLIAVGVITAAEELGLRVPADLSVVGFDGIRVDGFERRLTTVWQPAHAKGQAAGRAVLALLEGDARVVPAADFEVRFVLGDTTGPVPEV
ncbi:LacI family transcriptional regulator [Mycetocola tolaasinivorans]|uniref:LacI family transcriptional regulator n=1 Tax=Mycetocola tolaasinivorans TaxID=76635 RepID=A0A3L6ZXP1_9MICO|nr:LacI family DNA-binding transcriptional regulator [Mycetocola tolaasinivorans]RLP72679.1 LacI family transcriptional regulator [Mycetocola tolaasinivorans]